MPNTTNKSLCSKTVFVLHSQFQIFWTSVTPVWRVLSFLNTQMLELADPQLAQAATLWNNTHVINQPVLCGYKDVVYPQKAGNLTITPHSILSRNMLQTSHRPWKNPFWYPNLKSQVRILYYFLMLKKEFENLSVCKTALGYSKCIM